MRVAVIVIGIVMVSTPSYASKSCMTLSEARQQLGQVHLYWHGSGHCWDASAGAGRHGFIRHARHVETRQAQRDDSEPDPPDSKSAEPKAAAPKWRDAMSELLPDAPVFRSAAAAPVLAAAPIEAQSEAPALGLNWVDRWVEIVQIFPRVSVSHAAAPAARSQPTRFEPLVTPVRIILAFLAITLIIGVIEILFRSAIHEYRK